MKFVKLIALNVALFSSYTAVAREVRCHTKPTDKYPAPIFSFTAEVNDRYVTEGTKLQVLRNVKVKAQEQKSFDRIKYDLAYAPRKTKNQNRVRFKFDLPATDEVNGFDGIIHGVILPKVLKDEETLKENEETGMLEFRAIVTSSTDSYHDGIISYFRMNCETSAPKA